ncbi:MAG: hypothetical protein N2423_04190, partial [Novosphingobium sp.]|nr:hypothetical protein [Novosphingobium sp.]
APAPPRLQQASLSDADVERNFNEMQRQAAERARAIDEAPEVDVDADFDSWLEGLGSAGD